MNRQTIYLCDDDDGVRQAITFLLQEHDHRVCALASGPALLTELDRAGAEVRGVVILDVRMEPLSGLQVHELLIQRGLGERLPVLFLSGHGDIPMAVGAMARGAFNFVEKPYASDALLALINAALEREAQWYARNQQHLALRRLVQGLSRQQLRLMPMVAAGELNKTIAWNLSLSIRTVEEHRRKIFERLHVHSAAELATLLAHMQAAGIDLAACAAAAGDVGTQPE